MPSKKSATIETCKLIIFAVVCLSVCVSVWRFLEKRYAHEVTEQVDSKVVSPFSELRDYAVPDDEPGGELKGDFDWHLFLKALSVVESGGNPDAVGDNGRAHGPLQIHEIYLRDSNRIADTDYVIDDMYDFDNACRVAVAYLQYYGKRYEKITGLKADAEVYARIHNGGPNGWQKEITRIYWKKVQKELGLR